MALDVFIVAGEASADMHAANLLKELKAFQPDLRCFGVGGKCLAAEGVEIVLPAESLNVVGISDWFDRISEVWQGYRRVVRTVKERRPDVAILLDLPDFNLLLAKKLRKLGVTVVYYISPQVWAWRKYRIHQIKRDVDLMIVLFPFEKEFYDKQGIEAHFVGHPLLDTIAARQSVRSQALVLKGPQIAILPGSRRSEVRFHAPIFKAALVQLRRRYPGAKFKVPVAPTLDLSFVRDAFGDDSNELGIEYEVGSPSIEVLKWADVAIVASGTATLETALLQVPYTLMYKVTRSSAWIFRNLIRYKNFIGMPNILQQKEIVREFFQEQASPENLYAEVVRLIEDEGYRAQMVTGLSECRKQLGATGASQRAASHIHQLLNRKSKQKMMPLKHAISAN